MLKRAGKRSLSERMGLVERMQASGQTHSQWCEEHGINLRTMRDWGRLWRKMKEGCAVQEEVSPGKWVEVAGRGMLSISEAVYFPEISIRIGACTDSRCPRFRP